MGNLSFFGWNKRQDVSSGWHDTDLEMNVFVLRNWKIEAENFSSIFHVNSHVKMKSNWNGSSDTRTRLLFFTTATPEWCRAGRTEKMRWARTIKRKWQDAKKWTKRQKGKSMESAQFSSLYHLQVHCKAESECFVNCIIHPTFSGTTVATWGH